MEQINKKQFINKGDRSLSGKSHRGRTSNIVAYTLIGLSTAFTVGVLLWILGFIFSNGLSKVNLDFFTHDYDSVTSYVTIGTIENGKNNKLGIELDTQEVEGDQVLYIKNIESASLAEDGVDAAKKPFLVKEGDIVKKIARTKTEGLTVEEANELIDNQTVSTIRVQVTRGGGGIFHLMLTTMIMIGLSLLFACPIGISAAIYLTEYAKAGRLVTLIRFATESLSGIPSIIYGLFGMLFFVGLLKLGFSVLAGALTLCIVLLPVIIRQTEESLKAVPMSYREASLGLGATKLQTIRSAVLPSAIPGIVVAIILSIGRIVGESAALLLTAGTFAQTQASILGSGATLTVKAYLVAKEEGDIAMACGIGTVVLLIIFILNTLSKLMSRKFQKTN